MKNKRGGFTVGIAIALLAFFFIIIAFTTIEPLKNALDNIRGGDGLNCRGTATFNETAYNDDTTDKVSRLTRRPTCFITGIGMVFFVLAIVIAIFVWAEQMWGKQK